MSWMSKLSKIKRKHPKERKKTATNRKPKE